MDILLLKLRKMDGSVVAASDDTEGILKVTGDAALTSEEPNYLILEPTALGQSMDLASRPSPLSVHKDGVLFRGVHDYLISGGTLCGQGTWMKPLVWTHEGEGVVTFDGKLGYQGFVKRGPGTFVFKGQNALIHSLGIQEGVFDAASATALTSTTKENYYAVVMDGGTLRTSVDLALDKPLKVSYNGGVLDVVEGTTFTINTSLESSWESQSGPLRKIGEGILALALSEMTMGGPFELAAGTVRLESDGGLGNSTTRSRAIAPTEITGGTLDLNGHAAYLGNLVLKKGLIKDSVGGGKLGAYTFFVEEGQIDAVLTNTSRKGDTDDKNKFNALEKTGPGKVTLTAANEYTGSTLVSDGTLELVGSVAGPAWVEGGKLVGSGTISGTACVVKNGRLEPNAGSQMRFEDDVCLTKGGTLVLQGGAAPSRIALTTPGKNLYLDSDALFEPHFKGEAGSWVIAEIAECGQVKGMFANFEKGVYVDPTGKKYHLSTTGGDGNDVVLTTEIRGLRLIIR